MRASRRRRSSSTTRETLPARHDSADRIPDGTCRGDRADRSVDSGAEVQTSILVYGEITEYHRSLSHAVRRQDELQRVLLQIEPLRLDYPIMERYADIRRSLRPPYGPGLIGDIDTLIAATAMEHGLTLVTADSDFQRVPDLGVMLVPRRMSH